MPVALSKLMHCGCRDVWQARTHAHTHTLLNSRKPKDTRTMFHTPPRDDGWPILNSQRIDGALFRI
eukprot:15259083-Alexandrium_andersonii.AAC.1